MIKILKRNWHLIVLILFSLTPLLWFWGKDPNVLITGLDTNFPLDPLVWFLRRLFVWNSTVNAGSDFGSSISGLFFHSIQVIPYLLKFDLQTTEIISLVFWFSAIVTSSYLFARTLYPKGFLGQIVFVVIYSFNIYLFNTWENVKVSNLSLVVSLPLFLGIIYSLKKKRLSLSKVIFYSAVSSIIASGTGINPSYFASLVIAVLVFIFISLILNRQDAKSFLIGSFACLAVLFLVNFFWILPLSNQLFISRRVRDLSDIGLANWLDSLSVNTSLLNVLRLQGTWDWYTVDGTGTPIYVPYALRYFRSFPFIAFSFVLPLFSLISLILYKKSKKILYAGFAALLTLGTFLGAGSHEPTGPLYKFLYLKAPFFSFFRSPWYIFTPLIVISFAGLSLLLFKRLDERFKNKKILYFLGVLFIIGSLIYSYPLVLGRVFRPGRNDSFYVKFPDYVFETKEWLNQGRKTTGRIITYPDDQLETFRWGYRGTESILNLFSDSEVITPSFNYVNIPLSLLIGEFYLDIKKGDYNSAFSILPFLGVDTIFNKEDSTSLSRPINEKDPSIVEATLNTSFGEWSFLELKDAKSRKIYSPKLLYMNFTGPETFSKMAKILDPDSLTVESGDSEVEKIASLDNKFYGLIRAARKDEDKNIESNAQEYRVTAPVGGIYSLLIERKGSGAGVDSFSGATVSVDESHEIEITEDEKRGAFFELASLDLKKGDHKILISFPQAENLLFPNDFSQYSQLPGLRKDELPPDIKKTLVVFDFDAKNSTIKIPVPNFDPFHDYVLTYDNKYFYGNVPIVDVIQSAPAAPLKTFPKFAGSAMDWQHQQLSIKPVPVDSKLEIFIRAGSNKDSSSKSFMENVSVKRVYSNEVFLKQKEEVELSSPNVHATKASPVEYTIDVEDVTGPYFIAFLENYDSDWILTSDFSENPIHFSANGYANAWYLKGEKPTEKLRLYYRPQLYMMFGFAISGITLVMAIILKLKNGDT